MKLLDTLRANDMDLLRITYRDSFSPSPRLVIVPVKDFAKIDSLNNRDMFLVKLPEGAFSFHTETEKGNYVKGGKGELKETLVWYEMKSDEYIRKETILGINMIPVGSLAYTEVKKMMEDITAKESGIILTPEKTIEK
jgi:hypothetical protein